MKIRKAELNDAEKMCELCSQTILSVNLGEYTSNQVEVWAERINNLTRMHEKILAQSCIIIENKGKICGIATIRNDGYLDLFYIEEEEQSKGFGKVLLQAIISKAKSLRISEITSDVSISALPFFERHSFEKIKEQEVFIDNIPFINYKMKFSLTS